MTNDQRRIARKLSSFVSFSRLVELSNIHVKRHERDPLISLPNVLCLIINDLNRHSNGYGASMDEIKTTLKLQFPEFPLPTDDILYSTIGTLIQDKILLLKSKISRFSLLFNSFNFFVSTDGGYITLPCEHAKQVKTQFVTKDHKLYSSQSKGTNSSSSKVNFLRFLDEPKSIFSRLIHGFRRREQNQSPPFAFNAQLLSSPSSQAAPIYQAPRIMTDYGMIEPNAPFRASSRSHPHTMRRASLRTQSTDTRSSQQHQQHQQQQQAQSQQPNGAAGGTLFPPPLPPMTSSLSSNPIRRARPRSFSFDEQLSIIDDDDESLVHDMPFTVAPVRSGQPTHHHHHPHPAQGQHRRLNTSKVSSRCRTRRRRSRSLTKRTAGVTATHHRPTMSSAAQHEWLHTTDNHPQSTSSEEYDEDDDDDQDEGDEHDDVDQEPHFSPRSTSTAANRPRNRKPLLHASDFDRRLCEKTMSNSLTQQQQQQQQHVNQQQETDPQHEPLPHHTSPVSQPSTEPDEINLIVYSTNSNELLNATINSRKSEPNISLKKFSDHGRLLPLRYGSPDSGISGKTWREKIQPFSPSDQM